MKCPECNSRPLSEEAQPHPGTHACSVKYLCGGQVVYVIAGDYWEWETECPEMKPTAEEISDDN